LFVPCCTCLKILAAHFRGPAKFLKWIRIVYIIAREIEVRSFRHINKHWYISLDGGWTLALWSFSCSVRRRSRAGTPAALHFTQTKLFKVFGFRCMVNNPLTSVNDICSRNGTVWHSWTTRPLLIPTTYLLQYSLFVPDVSSLSLFSSCLYLLEIRSGTAINAKTKQSHIDIWQEHWCPGAQNPLSIVCMNSMHVLFEMYECICGLLEINEAKKVILL
jgi:hypothetical protein